MKNNKSCQSLAIFLLCLLAICSMSLSQNLSEKDSSSNSNSISANSILNKSNNNISDSQINLVNSPKQKLKSYLRHSSDSYERKYEIKNIEKYNKNYKLRINENSNSNSNSNTNIDEKIQNQNQNQNQANINNIAYNYLNFKLYLENIINEDYYNKCLNDQSFHERIEVEGNKKNEFYKYLFDYLDPIFYNDITTMYEKVGYDFFNNRDLISNDKSEVKMDDLKKIEHSFSHWGWDLIDHDYNSSAIKFLKKYDIDNDNTLNFTEFIKGVIDLHKGKYVLCHNCFHLIKLRIKAIFNVFKCSNKEVMSISDFKNGLHALENKDLFLKYDIFAHKINDSDLINLAIISFYQRYSSNEFYINEEEFVNGILLGYLERLYIDNYSLEDELIEEKAKRWDSLK